MCDIVVCIAKAQDNAEMDWLVYEIKLGASIVSLSTVYCKFDSLNVCKLNYYVFTSMCTTNTSIGVVGSHKVVGF